MKLTKLIYEDLDRFGGHRVSLEFPTGSDIDELMQQFRQLCLGAGFHPVSVREGFIKMSEDYQVGESLEDFLDEEDE